MYKIICKELTHRLDSGQADEVCDFVAEGATKEEAKNNFYTHGAEASLHKEMYENASDEEAEDFGKKLDEYLAQQNQ